tara:strand:+ start:381 stop:713 length:333 start_codon:yes stop_codon:yes gene_type:complete
LFFFVSNAATVFCETTTETTRNREDNELSFSFEENSLSTFPQKGDLSIARERETRTPFRDDNNNNTSDGRERDKNEHSYNFFRSKRVVRDRLLCFEENSALAYDRYLFEI